MREGESPRESYPSLNEPVDSPTLTAPRDYGSWVLVMGLESRVPPAEGTMGGAGEGVGGRGGTEGGGATGAQGFCAPLE